uniref:calretinin-like isoform X2 n=1 Tax=Myxine glutinosa TaxID=7769 RepID=UPI00358DFDE6
MANSYFQLGEVSAAQFLNTWSRYDIDGNGYIEDKELENFFRDLEIARHGVAPESNVKEKMQKFMEMYDKNSDGKIEMSELAQILPTEENFLLFFRQNVNSRNEFMETWRKYDADQSGYIEAEELKHFLRDLLMKANKRYDEPKLDEYTHTILKIFDTNQDGKLCLAEMTRLIPVQENFLLKYQGVTLKPSDFSEIFALHDKDKNGYIEEKDFDALLRDLLKKDNKDVSIQTIKSIRKSIMPLADKGKLYHDELVKALCSTT